jgi:hypothetical protein
LKKTNGIVVMLAVCVLNATVNAQQRDPRIGEFSEGATDEVVRVEANISGPFPSVFVKPFLVAGVQSPARLFISWQIPCHGRKESASSFDRGAGLLLTWVPLSCIVNQPADRS